MKIAFLCPYFGTFPKHIQLWLNSCATNKDTTYFLFTDDKQKLNYPDNFVVKYMTLNELKNFFQSKFNFEISLSGVYKLGDYKPLYGYLFEDLIKDYDAWGYLDVPDEICGDVSAFVNEKVFLKADKLMVRGHMTIFKNTPEVNKRFMADTGEKFNYKDIFSSEHFFNFEEIAKGSISWIYINNKWKMDLLNDAVADVSGLFYDFRRSCVSEKLEYYRPSKVPSIYARENGKIYGYFLENGKVIKREYLYLHFKRRKMEINVPLDSDQYLIVPNGFESYTEVTADVIKQYAKKKLFYPVFWEEVKKSIVRKCTKNNGR